MAKGVLAGLLAVWLLLAASMAGAAEEGKGREATQGEFAARLVEAFAWEGGLPENPREADYLAILGGNRTFRFEAEDHYDSQSDTVSVRNFNIFGPFTGRGWLSGITTPTAVHFRLFLPLAGRYTFKVAGKGDGQVWSIAGRAFRVNAGKSLHEVTVGSVFLQAGLQEFNVIIPPDGALDHLAFTAPAFAPIEPFGGWQFSAPLRLQDLAAVSVSLLGLEGRLPDDRESGSRTIHVATAGKVPENAQLTSSDLLGKFYAPKWVRAGVAPITVEVPVEVEKAAAYTVRVRFVGRELTAGFGTRTKTLAGKPYFDWLELGAFRLSPGKHTLQLQIPPTAGVDVVEVIRKKSAPADYLAAAGLKGEPAAAVKSAEVDDILVSLVDRFKERE